MTCFLYTHILLSPLSHPPPPLYSAQGEGSDSTDPQTPVAISVTIVIVAVVVLIGAGVLIRKRKIIKLVIKMCRESHLEECLVY